MTGQNPHSPRRQTGPKLIREVAKLAGVSSATVSRVANGLSTVDKTLAKRVWAAIDELGYVPNPQARALVTGRSRTLGLLVSEVTNPFFPELIESFEDIAAENDFEVMVGSTKHNSARARLFIPRLAQRRVEGVAVMTFRAESPLLDELIARDVPMVCIDEAIAAPRSLALEIDYGQGIHQAVQHLAVLGHRKFAYVGGPQRHLTNRLRQEAFLSAVQSIGVSASSEWMYEGEHTLEGGTDAAEKFLALRNRPTAVICSNDLTAIGILRIMAKHQVKVPQQMSVVGFDDIHFAEFSTPPLTSVRMSREHLARCAFDALMRLRNSEASDKHEPVRVPTSLVVRETTGFYEKATRGLNVKRSPRGK